MHHPSQSVLMRNRNVNSMTLGEYKHMPADMNQTCHYPQLNRGRIKGEVASHRFHKNRSKTRRFLLLISSVIVFGVIATQQAMDASANRSSGTPDYLTWLLRNEEPEPKALTFTPTTASIQLKTSPLSEQQESPTEKREVITTPKPLVDLANSRAVIERVRRGDTLSRVLQRRDVPMQTIMAIARATNPIFKLSARFKPGKQLKLTFDKTGKLSALDYPINKDKILHVAQGNRGFVASMITKSLGVMTNKTRTKNKQPQDIPDDPDTKDIFEKAKSQVFVDVRSGDILTTVLARHNIPQHTAIQVAKASRPVYDLARLMKPGTTLRLALDQRGQLMGLSYPLDTDRILWLSRNNKSRFTPHIQKKVYQTQLHHVKGTIRNDGSLFMASKKAGLSQPLSAEIARLFEWDVDFARDIRSGDQFKVIHEAKYYLGKRVGDGDIVAAEFVNQGRVIQVVRYTDPSGSTGYYDAKGRSVEKMFIRAPVDFTRVSSVFSNRRKHPVYGFTRAHKGVDYAAPTGTPVRASGDGRITFLGRKGGFGKLIVLRHNSRYTTAYAHLNRFTSKLKVGQRVKQGEVIGQVGSTGAATGPHLHYEFRVKGRQVNPLSVQLPTTNPLPRKYLNDFHVHTAKMLAQLNESDTHMASLSLSRSTSKR